MVFCFLLDDDWDTVQDDAVSVSEAGALGIIVAWNPSIAEVISCGNEFPCVQINYETGMEILYYIRSTR